jgi:hypothetical protein
MSLFFACFLQGSMSKSLVFFLRNLSFSNERGNIITPTKRNPTLKGGTSILGFTGSNIQRLAILIRFFHSSDKSWDILLKIGLLGKSAVFCSDVRTGVVGQLLSFQPVIKPVIKLVIGNLLAGF